MAGIDPTGGYVDDLIEEYQSQLDLIENKGYCLNVKNWLKGDTLRGIADKLGCTPATVNSKLGYIARTCEKKR
jgi:hypothetical protein